MCCLQCGSLGRVFVLRYFGVLLAHLCADAGDASALESAAVALVALGDELVVQNAVAAELVPRHAAVVLAVPDVDDAVLVVFVADAVLGVPVVAVVLAAPAVDAVLALPVVDSVLAVPAVQNAAVVLDVVQYVAVVPDLQSAAVVAPVLGDHGP